MNVVPGAKQLIMSMPGFVDCHALCMLVDSGAMHGYIDSAFVAKCGIKQYPTEGHVICVGGRSVPVTNNLLAIGHASTPSTL